jgi:LmbE family N-acetylglucosaminyl deacetylase
VNLFLSPHSDDEALFGTYTLLRHKPLVVVCFEGRRKRNYVPNEVRVAETDAAMRLLGCDFRQLPVPCDPPEWSELEFLVRMLKPERVWAPLPELAGHPHHNAIGNLARFLWPDKTAFYATYTHSGRSTIGDRVDEESGWQDLKQRALACYQSQNSKPDTAFHFNGDTAEYVTSVPPSSNGALRLNLGSGQNPIDGFTNLDKQTGWMFENGLPVYADQSVDAITVSHALMYVEEKHWPAVFAEMERVLKPGGVLRITEDDTAHPDTNRPGLRHRAAVATDPEILLDHIRGAGLTGSETGPHITQFADRSLIQENYGQPPDVCHVEGVKETT